MHHTLIVMDDEEHDALISRRMCHRAHPVAMATDAAPAPGALHANELDATSAELQLPDIAGMQALIRVRANQLLSHVPVATLTSLASSHAHRTTNLGA